MRQAKEHLKRIWLRIHTVIPEKYKDGFEHEILADNFTRLSVVSVALFFIEIALYLIEDRLFHTGPVILAFLISSAILVPQILYIKKNIKTISRIYALSVQYAYAASVLLFGAAVALYVQQKTDMVHIYLMMVLGISAFVHMKPKTIAILYTFVYLAFALALPYFQPNAEIVLTNSINSLIFNIFAWVLGRFVYRARLSNFVYKRMLREKNMMLKDLAQRDSMTGMLNHEVSFERLKNETEHAKKMDYPLSLIIADIDDFKRINDNFGHLQGDEIIKKIAQAIAETVKPTDIVGRYGGEEFIIIMPGTDINAASTLFEKIQSAVNSVQKQVTLSGGISQYNNESLNDFIRSTDEKLYMAKSRGKNRFETKL